MRCPFLKLRVKVRCCSEIKREISESSEDELDENFGKHGENSGDFDGNFGEPDDETVPGLGTDLNDLLQIIKKLLFPTPPHTPTDRWIGEKHCSPCTNEVGATKS